VPGETFMDQPVGEPPKPRRKRRKFRKYPVPACSPEEKAALYDYQQGRCGICGEEFPIKDMMKDHSYRDGSTRGLLCRAHKAALGFFKDSPQMLQKALRYLKRPPAREMDLRVKAGEGSTGGKFLPSPLESNL
jgi:hypothetical protein